MNYLHKIIVGDFNFPEIDWSNWMTTTNENHNSFRFFECLRDNYLEQFVNQPTRWRDLEPGNVLDLVLADSVDLINNLEITTRIGKSDHLCIEEFLAIKRAISLNEMFVLFC